MGDVMKMGQILLAVWLMTTPVACATDMPQHYIGCGIVYHLTDGTHVAHDDDNGHWYWLMDGNVLYHGAVTRDIGPDDWELGQTPEQTAIDDADRTPILNLLVRGD